jgi:two-component system chemotaxis response regulator CheY
MAKILIVDDSSFARNNMRIIVEKGGHEIAGLAEDGEQAVSLYKNLNPDLVMLDYLMVGKSGMEVLKELIQHDPDAKIIMVSGLGDSTIEDDALEAGAKIFVRKPYAQKNILKIIDQIVRN